MTNIIEQALRVTLPLPGDESETRCQNCMTHRPGHADWCIVNIGRAWETFASRLADMADDGAPAALVGESAEYKALRAMLMDNGLVASVVPPARERQTKLMNTIREITGQ